MNISITERVQPFKITVNNPGIFYTKLKIHNMFALCPILSITLCIIQIWVFSFVYTAKRCTGRRLDPGPEEGQKTSNGFLVTAFIFFFFTHPLLSQNQLFIFHTKLIAIVKSL